MFYDFRTSPIFCLTFTCRAQSDYAYSSIRTCNWTSVFVLRGVHASFYLHQKKKKFHLVWSTTKSILNYNQKTKKTKPFSRSTLDGAVSRGCVYKANLNQIGYRDFVSNGTHCNIQYMYVTQYICIYTVHAG